MPDTPDEHSKSRSGSEPHERTLTEYTEASQASDDTDEGLLGGAGYELEPDCSRTEFLAVAKVYARDVVEAFDLEVTVSDLEWDVSMRAKRRAGAVQYRDGQPERIVLTWEQFETQGWSAMAATIRHELIHAHLMNTGVGPGHGAEFERWADRLATPVNCERFAEPAYWVDCTDCETKIARYRRSKLVKQPGSYKCGTCGGSLVVTKND